MESPVENILYRAFFYFISDIIGYFILVCASSACQPPENAISFNSNGTKVYQGSYPKEEY